MASLQRDELNDLLDLYERECRARALGGWHAMSGFSFQAAVFLADIANGVLSASISRSFDAGMFEKLSDYLLQTPEALVCVQAKSTLSRKTLLNALAEFAAIEKFLGNHVTERERRSVRYQVIARKADQDLSWSEYSPPDSSSGEIRSIHTKLLSEERLLPIRIEGDPWWRFISLVYPRVENPLPFCHECISRLLRFREDPRAWGEWFLGELERRRRPPLLADMLTPSHFGRSEDPGTTPLLGQIPTIRHLRSEMFMPRERVVKEVLAKFDAAAGDHQADSAAASQTLPTLWLAGESGVGKSVLLLQILEHLVCERGDKVLWIRGRRGSLLSILEEWEDTAKNVEGPVYVAVDELDPTAAQEAQRLREIAQLVQHLDAPHLPRLIVTGAKPTSYQVLKAAHGAGFQIHVHTIGGLDSRDRVELDSWCKTRFDLPADRVGCSDLIVLRMIELLQNGPREFGQRFAARALESGLNERSMRNWLILNALGIAVPADVLTEDERHCLQNLSGAGDVQIQEGEDGQPAFRLQHQRLCPYILRAVVDFADDGTGDSNWSNGLLTQDVIRLLAHPATAGRDISWSVLSALAGNPTQGIPVDEALVARELVQWVKAQSLPTTLDPLRVWRGLAAWAARSEAVAQEIGFKSACQAALDELRRNPDHEEWGPAWEHLWDLGWQANALIESAVDWLRSKAQDPERPDWPGLWRRIWEIAHESPRLGASLVQELGQLGQGWLAEHPDSDGWSYVWTAAAKTVDSEGGLQKSLVVQMARSWLNAVPEATGWPFVWCWLVELMTSDPAVTPREELSRVLHDGGSWLSTNSTPFGWAFVWEELFRRCDNDHLPIVRADLIDLGISWLLACPEAPGWSRVYEQVAAAECAAEHPSFNNLLNTTLGYLRSRRTSNGWAFVWRSRLHYALAHENESIQEELIFLGIDRISNDGDFVEWSRVWQELLREARQDEDHETLSTLEAAGLRWLTRHPDRGSWSYVCRDFMGSFGSDEARRRIVDALQEWGRDTPAERRDATWGHRMEDAMNLGMRDIEVLRCCAEWCRKNWNQVGTPTRAAKALRSGWWNPALDELAGFAADRISRGDYEHYGERILAERLAQEGRPAPGRGWTKLTKALRRQGGAMKRRRR